MKKRKSKAGVLVFLGALVLLISNNIVTQQSVEDKQKTTLQQAITRAVLQCYALEGVYPTDIEYLEKEYGIVINHEKYEIYYEGFGANIMPNIQVIRRSN